MELTDEQLTQLLMRAQRLGAQQATQPIGPAPAPLLVPPPQPIIVMPPQAPVQERRRDGSGLMFVLLLIGLVLIGYWVASHISFEPGAAIPRETAAPTTRASMPPPVRRAPAAAAPQATVAAPEPPTAIPCWSGPPLVLQPGQAECWMPAVAAPPTPEPPTATPFCGGNWYTVGADGTIWCENPQAEAPLVEQRAPAPTDAPPAALPLGCWSGPPLVLQPGQALCPRPTPIGDRQGQLALPGESPTLTPGAEE